MEKGRSSTRALSSDEGLLSKAGLTNGRSGLHGRLRPHRPSKNMKSNIISSRLQQLPEPKTQQTCIKERGLSWNATLSFRYTPPSKA